MFEESEKVLERRLCALIKQKGGWAIKLLSSFVVGLPDRLCLVNGKAYFVEIKSTGKKPSPAQRVVHKRLERVGFTVYVIDTTEKLNEFITNL
jgi:hypothetical protein